jgi:glycosyltransferase involved in cell wall biosynthesis
VYKKELSDRLKAVLHVGTTENKNVLSVLYAIKLLLKRGIRVKLYIAGSWTQYLENSLSILSTEEREFVEYVGPLTRSSMASLLGKVRILTLPSFYECFPINVVESMCCGTPVIVSQAIPQELVIHGVNGFRIYNPMDYKSLAKYIEMLLQNDELWIKMSLNCLKLSERYDICSMTKIILNVYRLHYNDA